MYNDSTFNNLFTGYKSGSDYIYPEGSQNLVVKFANFYLSAKDGDFTTDPVTITSETGEGEDISIGNAPAKVLTATMLNPDGAMDSLTWGDGSVYIGAETASASADVYQSYPVHILVGTTHYSIDANGVPRRGTTSLGTLGGSPVAVISNSGGTDILFISSTAIGRRQGSTYSVVNSPSPAQAYMAAKFRAMPHSVGVLLDANGLPSVYNSVAEGTKQTFSYVPMGVFDFSGVDAYGITFGVEAYDKMTVFDADATEWWNSIDFSQGKQLQTLAGEVVSHYGLTLATLPNTAVNKTVSWNTNPITSYAVTGRDLLKWLAEAMGCNVRMSRTGTVEFWTFNTTAVATITPDTIVSSTRVVGRKSVPAVTQTVCYNVLGAGYTATGSTTTGTTYYVVANPFIDPSNNLAPLNAIHGIVTAIPAYYPITIAVSCADARWDAGDFVTITDTDNNSIAVPLMHQAMEWNGMCHATLSATGKQVRDIPESMLNTDLSSMVDSNPSAVVNKIQAVGISADWITSGTIDASVINVENVEAEKILVKDTSNNIIFQADAGNRVAKFHVEDSDGTVLFDVDSSQAVATIGGFTATVSDDYPYLEVDDPLGHASLSSQGLSVEPTNGQREAELYESGLWVGSGAWVNDLRTNQSSVTSTNIRVVNNSSIQVSEITPTMVEVRNAYASPSVYTRMERTGLTSTNSSGSTNVAPAGVGFDDGTASSTLSVIKRTMDSAGTTNITLQRGMYLAIVSHTNNTTAGQQGLYLIQAYDSNSVVLTIAAAANSTLTVSGLTLTWTTTNTYRALRLIYLS